ncbi:putative S-layer protein [Peribacillus simplex]|uniref:S-layer protein n=1 Tax=Peribacillus simplex TaxID=1478 RepID=A0AAN2PEY5_9BACI|nr:putative S-layer protein [Peribacillus simplex]
MIKSLNVKSVYAPKVSHTTQAYKDFLTAVKKKTLTIKKAKTGVEINTKAKDNSLKFIAPVKDYAKSDLNNWSALLLLKHGKKKHSCLQVMPKKKQRKICWLKNWYQVWMYLK